MGCRNLVGEAIMSPLVDVAIVALLALNVFHWPWALAATAAFMLAQALGTILILSLGPENPFVALRAKRWGLTVITLAAIAYAGVDTIPIN